MTACEACTVLKRQGFDDLCSSCSINRAIIKRVGDEASALRDRVMSSSSPDLTQAVIELAEMVSTLAARTGQ